MLTAGQLDALFAVSPKARCRISAANHSRFFGSYSRRSTGLIMGYRDRNLRTALSQSLRQRNEHHLMAARLKLAGESRHWVKMSWSTKRYKGNIHSWEQ